MSYLERLRATIIDGSGYDKMDKPPPRDQWERIADEEINAMSITELLWHIDLIGKTNAEGF